MHQLFAVDASPRSIARQLPFLIPDRATYAPLGPLGGLRRSESFLYNGVRPVVEYSSSEIFQVSWAA
jgi:hypothetical protein